LAVVGVVTVEGFTAGLELILGLKKVPRGVTVPVKLEGWSESEPELDEAVLGARLATLRSVRGWTVTCVGAPLGVVGTAEEPEEAEAVSGGRDTLSVFPSGSSVSRRGVVLRTSVVSLSATCRTLPRVACEIRSNPTPLFTTLVLFTVT
jgi:hypothetical protein